MQLFFIAALLLSAVAAVPPGPGQSGRPQSPPNGAGSPLNKPGPLGPGGRPGKPQGPPNGEGFNMNKPGPLGPGGHHGKPQGPPKGEGPHRNPGPLGNIVFSPTFKVENVTFQSATNATLPEGESVFLMPKFGERGPHPHQGEKRGPPVTGQYVKLIYNSTLPNKFSMEFGVFKPMNIAALVMEEDNDEGAVGQLHL